MEGIKSFFESFKEFIWDIIGYILPGAYFFILTSLSINSNYWLNVDSVFDSKYYPYVIVILSYLVGYAVYGLNILIYKKKEIKILKKMYKIILEKTEKEIFKEIFKRPSYIDKAEDKIKNRINYKSSIQILQKRFTGKEIPFDPKKANIRDLRSIAMGFFPEQDQKVYTFAFRADIANHAGTISLLFGIFGLLSYIINCITPFDLVNIDCAHFILYTMLVISYFLFASMRNYFYAISLGLPFSLLSTSEINEKK